MHPSIRTRTELERTPREFARLATIGWECQDHLRYHDTGIPLSVFQKIVTNILFEVNSPFASLQSVESHHLAPFLSLWTPYRFGAVFTIPSTLLEMDVDPPSGRAYVKDLASDSGARNYMGMKILLSGTKDANDQPEHDADIVATSRAVKTWVKFDTAIRSSILEWINDRVITNEEYFALSEFASIFSEVYRISPDALNAFATCRTLASTITAIDTEIVICKADLDYILHHQQWLPGSASLKRNINSARACAEQIKKKTELRMKIAEFVDAARLKVKHYSLHSLVLSHFDEPVADSALELRMEIQSLLHHFTELVAVCLSKRGCYPMRGDTTATLKKDVGYLRDTWGVPSELAKLLRNSRNRQDRWLSEDLSAIASVVWDRIEQRLSNKNIPLIRNWYWTLENNPLARLDTLETD